MHGETDVASLLTDRIPAPMDAQCCLASPGRGRERAAQDSCAQRRYPVAEATTMLVRLFGKNFGAFRDGFDLSLEALPLGSDDGRGYFEVALRSEEKPLRLLRLAAIYGPNASGKSTVIRAAEALHGLVVHSGPGGQEGEPIRSFDPFLLHPNTQEAPVELGCEVVVEERVVRYEVSFTREHVVRESATTLGGDGEPDELWMHREGESVSILSPERRDRMTIDLGMVTRNNAAAISVAAQLKQAPLLPLYRAIRDSTRTIQGGGRIDLLLQHSLRRLQHEPEFRHWTVESLLRAADLGIDDVRAVETDTPAEVTEVLQQGGKNGTSSQVRKPIEAFVTHRGEGGTTEFHESQESDGTRKLLALAGPWHDVLHGGLTLFVDELTASLHTNLVVALLNEINSGPTTRPCQLIFTTHDVNILENVLRRDQVWFTDKNSNGAAELYSLGDMSERQNVNIRKRYLEGRYGAVPRTLLFDLFGDEETE